MATMALVVSTTSNNVQGVWCGAAGRKREKVKLMSKTKCLAKRNDDDDDDHGGDE